MSDISLIPTDNLINELVKRHDHITISAIKFTNNKGEFVQVRRREGNRLLLIAQLEIFKQIIIEEEKQANIPINENLDR